MSERVEQEQVLKQEQDQDQEQGRAGLITKVERQKRAGQRYNIFIDDIYALSVHEDILIKHQLMKGQTVEQDELQRVLEADERQRAYHDALRLLSSRLRSEHEISARLIQKGFGAEIAKDVVERLKSEGYLNDTLFAEMLTRQRLESQKKGRHWIKQELKQKGLSKEKITQAMEQVDEETEYEMALALASKRYKAELARDPLKAGRKLAGFLQRRGYPGHVVSRVLSRLKAELSEEDGWETWDESEMDDI